VNTMHHQRYKLPSFNPQRQRRELEPTAILRPTQPNNTAVVLCSTTPLAACVGNGWA
jgi:hypothetical protein